MLRSLNSHFAPLIKSFTFNSLRPQSLFLHNEANCRNFSSLFSSGTQLRQNSLNILSRYLLPATLPQIDISRNVTKFNLKSGGRRSVKSMLTRFYRLDTGLWIRRRAGCHKRLHKRSEKDRFRLEQHVVCTRTQCIMFDKMVTPYWKKKKYYIDDPYEPYQVRNNFKYTLPRKNIWF